MCYVWKYKKREPRKRKTRFLYCLLLVITKSLVRLITNFSVGLTAPRPLIKAGFLIKQDYFLISKVYKYVKELHFW